MEIRFVVASIMKDLDTCCLVTFTPLGRGERDYFISSGVETHSVENLHITSNC